MLTLPRSTLRTSLHWLRYVMAIILIAANFATVILAGAAPAQADIQPSFPLRAAFYYPWFPEAWDQYGINPYTNYTPSLGFYDGRTQTVIQQHIAAMQYGGIQVGIASWWGQGSREDGKIPALLQGAAGTSFRWSVYYENESTGNPSAAQITSDLTYLRDHYGNDPSFLRINGRFVVFVYSDGGDNCGMADRWKQANTVGAYIVLKVFSGYRNCINQPDSWHQYSPAVAADSQQGYSYSIAPGFWQKGGSVRLARDLNRWSQNIQDMVASGAPFQLIATFNEWGEGTAVESAQEWASASGYGAYLDVLHNVIQPQPTTTTIAPPLPTSSPLPSPTRPTQTPIATKIPTATPTQLGSLSKLTFKPVADAYVTAGAPKTNYGGSQQLRVDASPIVNSYLRFTVQGVNAPIASAKLKIYAIGSSSAGIKVYGVSSNSWVENTITFNNAPPLGSLAGSIGNFTGNTWIAVDITSLIKGNGTFSVALTGLSSTSVSLASRENATYAPRLIVTTR